MKKYFIYTCFAGMMLQACESDLEKAYYSGENSTPAVIEAINQEYVLDKFATDENVIEFKWTAPDLGYSASVSNNIEMDVKGNNFGDNKVTLVSVKDKSTTASLSNKELNDQIETLLKKYDMPLGKTDIEFRISSVISDAVQGVSSNVISTSITPYDKSGRIAAVLNSLETEYDLSQNGGNIVLDWEEAYMGDNIKVTYSIEMNLEENVFSKRIILGKVVNETSFSITFDELNSKFIDILNSYSKNIDEAKVNFRIICEGSSTEGAVSSNVVTTILKPSVETFTLNALENQNVTLVNDATSKLTLDWGDAAAIESPKYNVEMIMGEARKTIAYSLPESTVELSHTALNKDILYMVESLGLGVQSPYSVTFRVKASNAEGKMAIYSNEIEANVTTFDIAKNTKYLEIRGEYNRWESTKTQKLYKVGDNEYSGMIYVPNLYDGWKVVQNDTWWGVPKDEQQTNWDEKQIFTGDQANITGYGQSSYTFRVKMEYNNDRLYMSNEEKTWYLSGDFNNWSRPSADQRLELKNDDTKYWLEDAAEMKTGQRWQIISEVRRMLVTPENIEGHFEKYDDSFFTVPEDGTYTIKWYFNEATPYLIVTKK